MGTRRPDRRERRKRPAADSGWMRGNPGDEATLQLQRGLVLPNAAAFTDHNFGRHRRLVDKHLANYTLPICVRNGRRSSTRHDLARAGGRRITSGWRHPGVSLRSLPTGDLFGPLGQHLDVDRKSEDAYSVPLVTGLRPLASNKGNSLGEIT